VVTVVAVLAGLWLLADLRDRTRPPGSRRAAVLAVPQRVRRVSIAAALAVATAVAVLAVPVVPTVDVLGGEEPPGWLQRLTLPDTDRRGTPSDPVVGRHTDRRPTTMPRFARSRTPGCWPCRRGRSPRCSVPW
jgi:hypothetical protein